MTYLTVPLNSLHRRGDFSCGKVQLDNYLHNQVSQDVKRKLSACFILQGENDVIKGFYTLSNDSIPADHLPSEIRKKMPPSYTNLPTTLLGRLAVDKDFAKQGLGELLLLDALKRSYDISDDIGSMAVIVDPLDNNALLFYKKYGFIELPDSGRMFLPMKLVSKLFVT
ncbi:MAG: GNAT family N-acetyltransferase [Bacteroidetes bacterium]|nr:GNAT family N-acetyltransferase [Bacteroidota bacterium]